MDLLMGTDSIDVDTDKEINKYHIDAHNTQKENSCCGYGWITLVTN